MAEGRMDAAALEAELQKKQHDPAKVAELEKSLEAKRKSVLLKAMAIEQTMEEEEEREKQRLIAQQLALQGQQELDSLTEEEIKKRHDEKVKILAGLSAKKPVVE